MKVLSVILCTWNNAARLRITLDAIAQCEVPEGLRWELVLVNNNCTDDTDAVAAAFAERLPLRVVHEPTPGLSHARNAGLAAATGGLVLFTDDDVRPYPSWLAAYWEAYERYPAGHYFGGPLESEFEAGPPPDELLSLAPWSVRGMDWGPEEVAHEELRFVSANWAVPRRALDAVGGFDPSLGIVGGSAQVSVGEESDLMARLERAGWTPRYLPAAKLRHFVPADKATAHHIGERHQANSYNLVVDGRVGPNGGRSLLGVPLGVWRSGTRLALGYAWARAQGRTGHSHYVSLQGVLGKAQAYRALRRERKPARG